MKQGNGRVPSVGLRLSVRTLTPTATRGLISIGSRRVRCALGRAGRIARKREGDGASPNGVWRMTSVLYRADRVVRPRTGLPISALKPTDGWCDTVGDRNYNRRVKLPYPASAERLWREDRLYDVLVVLDHNQRPRVQGGGSAIFMHLARPHYLPTEGCIGLSEPDLRCLLALCTYGTRLLIGP